MIFLIFYNVKFIDKNSHFRHLFFVHVYLLPTSNHVTDKYDWKDGEQPLQYFKKITNGLLAQLLLFSFRRKKLVSLNN